MGLTWRQWLLIVGCAALALGVIDLLHPPTPIALWLGTVLLTAPVAVSYFTSGATVSFGRALLDHAQWVLAPRELPASRHVARVRARGFVVGAPARGFRLRIPRRVRRTRACPSSGDLLPLEALSAEGVGVLGSGVLVRWIEVSPVNPLIHDTDGAEHIARAFTSIAGRLPDDRQSLELIAQATPLAIDALLAAEREACHSAVQDARSKGCGKLAVAIERLGLAAGTVDPHSKPGARSARYAVLRRRPVAPGPRRTPRPAPCPPRPAILSPAAYERALRESARHAEGVEPTSSRSA